MTINIKDACCAAIGLVFAAIAMGATTPLHAQAGGRLAFEVASIKPGHPFRQEGQGPSEKVEWGVDRLTAYNTPLGSLIWIAFRLGGGGDDSYKSHPAIYERFDIEAKAPGPAAPNQLREMLVSLLQDRFKLVTHYDTKEVPAFVLVTGKNGHKLHEAVGGPRPGWEMVNLAGWLRQVVKEPVIDMTGLTGRYDNPLPFRAFNDPDDPESATRAALKDQLGLALESRRMKVDFLVIDHLEKTPTEN